MLEVCDSNPRLASSSLLSFRTYVACPQTQYVKRDAACVQFLNSHDREGTLDGRVEIRKQSALDEAEEPEFEPKEGTVTVCSRLRGLD